MARVKPVDAEQFIEKVDSDGFLSEGKSDSGLRHSSEAPAAMQPTGSLFSSSREGRGGLLRSNSLFSQNTVTKALNYLSTRKEKPIWEWKDGDDFNTFNEAESDRIERFWLGGYWMMRMKSSEEDVAKPREIYFADMVQHHPSSGTLNAIRRIPPAGRWQQLAITGNAMLRSFLIGEHKWWKPKTRKHFEKLRHASKSVVVEEEERHRVDSWWYHVSESWTFSMVSLIVIILNSIYIWIDADYNPGVTLRNTPVPFIIADNLFAIWFLFEAVSRLMAYKKWRFVAKDSWLMLDIMLVALMVFETWILLLGLWILRREGLTLDMNKFSMLRGVRLLRLVRIARLFKVFPQLFVLVQGMALAMKSLVYTLLLLSVMNFLFGVAMKNFADIDVALKEAGFGTVRSSMWYLLIDGLFMDNVGDRLNQLLKIKLTYVWVFLAFIFISNLTMLNMLIGVLCDVITRVTEEQSSATELEMLEKGLIELLETYDTGSDRSLSRDEFGHLLANPDFRMILTTHNIDPADLMRLEEVLYEETDTIDFDAFLEKVFQLRGGNTATVNDMAELRCFLNKRFSTILQYLPGGVDDIPQLSGAKTVDFSGMQSGAPPSGGGTKVAVIDASKESDETIVSALASLQATHASDIDNLKANHCELETEINALRESLDQILRLLPTAASTPALVH